MRDSARVFAVRRSTFCALIVVAALFQILSPKPLLAGVVPDPACVQECDDRYIACMYEDCDQRGVAAIAGRTSIGASAPVL